MDSRSPTKPWTKVIVFGVLGISAGCSQAVLLTQETEQGSVVTDLFKEDSGVVAEGRFRRDGRFVATEILAKHDENYRPPEAAGEKHKSGTLQ